MSEIIEIKRKKNLWKDGLQLGWRAWLVIILMAIVVIIGLACVESKMYSGETYTYDTDIKEMSWKVEGNSSNLDGLNISLIDGKILLDFDLTFKPDNFTLIFYDNYTQEEVVTYENNDEGDNRGDNGHWVTTYLLEDNDTLDLGGDEIEVPQETEELETEEKGKLGFYLLVGLIILVIIGVILGILHRKDKVEYVEEIEEPQEIERDSEVIYREDLHLLDERREEGYE